MPVSSNFNAEQCRFNPDRVSHNSKENGGDAIIIITTTTPLQVPPVGITQEASLAIRQH